MTLTGQKTDPTTLYYFTSYIITLDTYPFKIFECISDTTDFWSGWNW